MHEFNNSKRFRELEISAFMAASIEQSLKEILQFSTSWVLNKTIKSLCNQNGFTQFFYL